MSDLNDSVQYIKGVGPSRAQDFAKLEVCTVRELLYSFPRCLSDRSNIFSIAQAEKFINQEVSLQVRVVDAHKQRTGRKTITTLNFSDSTGEIDGVWFNVPWVQEAFLGQEVMLFGKVILRSGKLQMLHPRIERLAEGSEDTLSAGRVVPVYPLTGKLTQGAWLRIMRNALVKYAGLLEEYYPQDFLKQRQLMGREEAVSNMHFPTSITAAELAKQRLIYDEFLLLQLGLAYRRQKNCRSGLRRRFRIERKVDQRIRALLPFRLTDAQEQAIAEITEDLSSPQPMYRLLQGDVGCGKTIVAFYVALLAAASGMQVVLMAPTELLARQHEETFNNLLGKSARQRLRVGLLVGSMQNARRQALLAGIAAATVDIVIGTHAAIQSDVAFKNLGLVIIDEQHKFGVAQRIKLAQKGRQPEVLVMTATPIPRSLALSLYGDLEVTTINSLPPGHKRVRTFLPKSGDWRKVWQFLRRELGKNRQAYIVSPLIEENEKLRLHSATEAFTRLSRGELADFKLALLHGKMKRVEQQEIMQRFRNGEIDALVSTVVIEVGVNVPNATLMVILQAERFGLAQLHQLRGRISRGKRQGYCFLISDTTNELSRERLKILTQVDDGFRIAEEDLRLRGEGEFLGTRQHGRLLKLGSIVEDFVVLQLARTDAREILKRDPELQSLSFQTLAKDVM